MAFFHVIELLGGLGLFLYGMRVMSDGIQQRAGTRLRTILDMLTRNRWTAMATGMLITSLIQSSSATTVLLVSIVHAGLMQLPQAIGVIMGANIGTTFTAWIVSLLGFHFKITALALPALALGVPFFFSRYENRREVARILIGFGLLFLGLNVMKESVPDIQHNPQILSFLERFSDVNRLSILLFVAIGAVITVVVQSSSAAMAVTITMAYKGWISFPLAAAIVLGENIGTTFTAYLASIGMQVTARRAARAHFMFNVFGVCWIWILFFPFIELVDALIPGDMRDPTQLPFHLAAFHSLFNIVNTLLLIGFIPQLVKLVEWMVKDHDPWEEAGRLAYIPLQTSEAIESNLISARAELGRMANLIYDMVLWVMNALQDDPEAKQQACEKIFAFKHQIHEIRRNISRFLTSCMMANLNENQANRIRAMYHVAQELEHIGYTCKRIMKWLDRRRNIRYYKTKLNDLSTFIAYLLDFLRLNADHLNARMSMEPQLEEQDLGIARNIHEQRQRLRKMVRRNLAAGGDVHGSMIFLDIIHAIELMAEKSTSIAEEIGTMDLD